MVITAHRGSSGTAPENTIIAIEKAITDGADMVEFDVQRTVDGKIVLIHDEKIDRTTNGTGYVSELDWDYLKTVDAGSWFDPIYAGESIPLLSDALELCKDRIRINIEMKTSYLDHALIGDVLDLIDKKKCREQTMLTSFHQPITRSIHRRNPNIKTGYILNVPLSPRSRIWHSPCSLISIDWMLVNDKLIKVAHQSHKEVHAWTVNEPSTMVSMIQYGVDGIFTNHPALLKSVLRSQHFILRPTW